MFLILRYFVRKRDEINFYFKGGQEKIKHQTLCVYVDLSSPPPCAECIHVAHWPTLVRASQEWECLLDRKDHFFSFF